MRKPLTRALAGTAIAAAAVLTAVGTAGAAGATTKLPTTLTAISKHAVIHAGQTDLLTGTLMSGSTPLNDKVVVLDRFVAGKPVAVDVKTTGIHGHVFFTVKPGKTARYQLVFSATAKYQGSKSNIVTIEVLPKPTTILTIGETKTTIKPGGSAVVFGTLSSGKTPLAGQIVSLCSEPKGAASYSCARSHLTGPAGGVRFAVSPSVTTRYFLKFKATLKYAGTHSGVVTLTVS